MQFLKALLFIVSFHIGTPLWAAEAALEMVHIKSSVSDLLAKIEVISQAQKSIDVVTYHHDDTKSSFLLMEALRMAALRGVQVRYIYDRMATQKGSSDFSEAYLNILRKAGVQMRALTVLERFKKWRFFKIIHSKQIIADAGENRRVSVFGGRNAGDRYLHWIDNTFVMTWPKGSFLDKKISEYFELLWGALPGYVDEKKYTTVPERMFSNEKELKQAVLANLESDDKNRVLQEAVDVSRLLVREKAQVLPYFEFAENEVDFLSSGMVGRFLGGDQYDEVNEAFRDILAQSRQVKISTIFFYLSDNSRSHLQRFLKRGGSIFIYSNQSSSFSAVLDKEEDYQSKSLEVMQSEEIRNLRSYGDVEIHLFRPGKMLFYHSKFVVGDKAVIITSSNMNYASDKNSEENGFLFKSVVFADYMRDFSSDMEKEYFSKDHPEGKPGVLENISGSILRNFF